MLAYIIHEEYKTQYNVCLCESELPFAEQNQVREDHPPWHKISCTVWCCMGATTLKAQQERGAFHGVRALEKKSIQATSLKQ